MADDDKTEVAEDRGDVVATADGGDPPKVEAKTEEKVEAKTEEKVEAKTEEKVEAKTEEKAEEGVVSGQMVPLTRFRAQNIRLKEAEEALAKAQEELNSSRSSAPAPAPSKEPDQRDFAAEAQAIEAKLDAAVKDNDTAAILAANRELRALDRAEYDARLEEQANRTNQVQQTVEDQRFNAMLEAVEREYPALDPTNPAADVAKIDATQALVSAYEAQGYASDDALVKAVGVLFPEAAAPASAPAPAPAPAPRGIKEKLAAVESTPPNLATAEGGNSDSAGITENLDPSKLSDEDFENLPEATKKRLRGDTVAA